VTDDDYRDDDAHPVPKLGVIDVNTVKKGGGSDLFLVVAKPLPADHRSLKRLLKKVENYLAFIGSDAFRRESGCPTPDNTRIVVKLHPGSAAEAFELLERNKQWVINNSASLVIETDLTGRTH
jgi:hypothetical protein